MAAGQTGEDPDDSGVPDDARVVGGMAYLAFYRWKMRWSRTIRSFFGW